MYAAGFIVLLLMSLIAIAANNKLHHLHRLPMQWSLSGQVNWSAPRVIALASFPAIFAAISSALILTSISEHEQSTAQSLIFLGIVMIGLQILHLWLVHKKSSH